MQQPRLGNANRRVLRGCSRADGQGVQGQASAPQIQTGEQTPGKKPSHPTPCFSARALAQTSPKPQRGGLRSGMMEERLQGPRPRQLERGLLSSPPGTTRLSAHPRTGCAQKLFLAFICWVEPKHLTCSSAFQSQALAIKHRVEVCKAASVHPQMATSTAQSREGWWSINSLSTARPAWKRQFSPVGK